MINPELTITGLQEVQAAMNKTLSEMQPRGAFGRAVTYVTIGAHAYLAQITHVDTGAYRAAHRARVDLGTQPRGVIFVDSGARNPRTKERVVDYSVKEEARGGSHAAYARTYNERGGALLGEAGRIMEGALPSGGR